jgi:hypothetical protein
VLCCVMVAGAGRLRRTPSCSQGTSYCAAGKDHGHPVNLMHVLEQAGQLLMAREVAEEALVDRKKARHAPGLSEVRVLPGEAIEVPGLFEYDPASRRFRYFLSDEGVPYGAVEKQRLQATTEFVIAEGGREAACQRLDDVKMSSTTVRRSGISFLCALRVSWRLGSSILAGWVRHTPPPTSCCCCMRTAARTHARTRRTVPNFTCSCMHRCCAHGPGGGHACTQARRARGAHLRTVLLRSGRADGGHPRLRGSRRLLPGALLLGFTYVRWTQSSREKQMAGADCAHSHRDQRDLCALAWSEREPGAIDPRLHRAADRRTARAAHGGRVAAAPNEGGAAVPRRLRPASG